MDTLPEFDRRPTSLVLRASVFFTVFEEMVPAFAAITAPEQVRANVRVLTDFLGHAADWRKFMDECTEQRLSVLSWDEMKALEAQFQRNETVIVSLEDEISRIKRLVGV